MKFTNVSDGTGEAAVDKVTPSGLSGAPGAGEITRMQYDVVGMVLRILGDATADVDALILSSSGYMDFAPFGGLKNNAGAGKTGKIQFTTIGHSANDTYCVIIEMEKE